MNINQYINDGQDPKVVEKLLLKLQDMLTSDERVTYIAVQKKPAVTLFPDTVTLTKKRIFLCRSTKMGLATDFNILPLTDVKEVSFKEGILGATFIVTPFEGENWEVAYIPKSQARKLYQLVKESMEKNLLEEPTLKVLPPEPEDELTLKLKKLKTLFERQLITQAEYESKKNELLSQL